MKNMKFGTMIALGFTALVALAGAVFRIGPVNTDCDKLAQGIDQINLTVSPLDQISKANPHASFSKAAAEAIPLNNDNDLEAVNS